ncbi:hypothetical protein GNX71_28455 [Variovorax sp. RKNM96]|uniref:hypothetical protein n=1 Tax=Variovorax sp. RKNM96 TaxID=2681552 RepID=UPI00198131A4|nr:hypothetical protein [Variovorax sp. RKNM96]QSI33287.1 hypothetical protein GNX71_28455 [Variovorax sp. RKNM96]
MEKGIAAALIACALMTACATPLPIVDYASTEQREAGTFARYQPLNNFYDVEDVIDEFEAYHFLYSHAANELRLKSQGANEVGFYSSLVAVVAGIAKSRDPVIAGGVLAAGSSMYSERYKLEIQISNYELASRAMRCMYVETREIGTVDLDSLKFVIGGKNLDAKPETLRIARDGFLEVRDKIWSLQAKVVLGTPDLGKLKEVAATAKDSLVAGTGHALVAAGFAVSDDATANYRNRMKACTAIITG